MSVRVRTPRGVRADELARFRRSGAGASVGFGDRPALVIVDVTRGFTDEAYPFAIGPEAPAIVRSIARLLDAAREVSIPVIHVTGSPAAAMHNLWVRKHHGTGPRDRLLDPRAHEIVPAIAPGAGEIVLTKSKPSAFFGTMLAATLTYYRVDTVILAGLVTSGCIRATAVDAYSHNYRVIIAKECVGDRVRLSHEVNLFDLSMKYADIMSLRGVLQALRRVVGAR
ncbi:MAG: isochorismatase family protein [Armatimonadota bacterium]